MWTEYFDKILLINLPRRKDRLAAACAELVKYNIPFSIEPGIEPEGRGFGSPLTGEYGIWLTLKQIFSNAVSAGIKRLLIFEDDVTFVEDPNYYFPWMLDQLEEQTGWHIFYLGPNTHGPLQKVMPNLLLAKKCRGLHAVAYSYDGMVEALENMKMYFKAVDTVFETHLQGKNKCFCAFPMIATQRNGHSDIDNKEVDNTYIVSRFKENTKHLE